MPLSEVSSTRASSCLHLGKWNSPPENPAPSASVKVAAGSRGKRLAHFLATLGAVLWFETCYLFACCRAFSVGPHHVRFTLPRCVDG